MAEEEAIEVDYAPGWRPGRGDQVVGTVTDVAATDLGQGIYPIVTLKRDDGEEVAVHAFHSVLRKELARRRTKVGDKLDITYLGKNPTGGYKDKGYHVYRVRGDGDAVGYDWDSELSPDERRDEEVPIASAPVPREKPLSAKERVEADLPPIPDTDDVPF